MALNAKQQQFINHYLTGFNATQAALSAGYSEKTGYSQGARLLKNVEIAEAIAQRLSETAMTADEVLMRLGEQARGDMAHFATVQGADVVIDLTSAMLNGQSRLIKKLTQKRTARTIGEVLVEEVYTTIELYDAQAALKLLGEHHGLFNGTPEAPQHVVNYTHAEWVAEQEKRQQQAQQAFADFDSDE